MNFRLYVVLDGVVVWPGKRVGGSCICKYCGGRHGKNPLLLQRF